MKNKILSLSLVAVMICCLLSGCGSVKEASSSFDATDSIESGDVMYSSSTSGGGGMMLNKVQSPVLSENKLVEDANVTEEEQQFEKIVYTANIEAQTMEFDETASKIKETVSKFNGYFEDSSISGGMNLYSDSENSHYANYTIKIPAEKFEEFVSGLDPICNITQQNISSDNVTLEYIDTETRLNNLKKQEEKFNELLTKVDSLDQIIEIEKQLTETRSQIESITTSFERLKNKISYSTINLSLEEVIRYSEAKTPSQSYFERAKNQFLNSWKDFGYGIQDFSLVLIGSVPTLLVFALIIFMGVKIVLKRKNKKKDIKNSLAQKENETIQQINK